MSYECIHCGKVWADSESAGYCCGADGKHATEEEAVTDNPSATKFAANVEALMGYLGAPKAACSKCGAVIFWITTKNGKKMPINAYGVAHWSDCPYAESFRK